MSQLPWDPEIDTPATIAIIGTGPLGIEAALYARFLGYYVLLFDEGKVAANVLGWGHARMFTPFELNCSPLGLAALESHDQLTQLPAPDASITGREFAELYLVPLARTDLVYDSVNVFSKVVSISRTMSRKWNNLSIQDRADQEFRLVVQSKNRGWYAERADIVLDCSGAHYERAGLGPGGGLALGEIEFAEHICRRLPDVLGNDRARFAGKHTLLLGGSYRAALVANMLSELMHEHSGTQVTWVTNHQLGGTQSEVNLDHTMSFEDRYSARGRTIRSAMQLLNSPPAGMSVLGAWGIERLSREEQGQWQIRLLVAEEDTLDLRCDEVVVAVQGTGAGDFCEDLNVQPITASIGNDHNPQELNWDYQLSPREGIRSVTSEPHYYVLGRQSFGVDDRFLIHHGHEQIRYVFSLIAGRPELDLYKTVHPSG